MGLPPDLPDDIDSPAEAEGVAPRERPMGFLDHLEELRWTLVKSAIAFAVFAILIGIFLREFNDALLWPLHHVQAQMAPKTFVIDLGTTSVMEGFTVVIQMCIMGGLVMAAPFILFFIGQFVSPALNQKELKLLVPGALTAFLLFLAGAAFSFFLLVPSTIRVSLELNELLGFTQRWTPGNYYSLLTWLTVGVGAAFEFPLLIVLLVYLGMVTVAKLRGWWRHALVVIFIISAIVTPTPDPVTQTMLAVPLYALYWIAILVASRVEKRKA
jgi:sec-independent protein translocase protein TatC